jgi:heat shock protein HslJ
MKLPMAFVGIASLAALLGCSGPETGDEGKPAVESASAPSRAPTAAELATATYTGIEGQGSVTLVDGKWEGEPFVEGGASVPAVWLTDVFHLAGDLDGDGAEEAVAHLTFSSGGTGNFGYLAVMGREGDAIVQEGLAEIGDRVQIRDARIEDRRIVLDVLQVGPEDGLCCPTQLARRAFAMQGGALVETATEVVGTASLATLEGREWVLRKLSSTENAPAEPEVTLTVDGDRLSGSSGCNRYNGTIETGETATSLVVGPLATTRMACPPELMDLEQRVTAALQGVQSWGFHIGQLVIHYQQGDEFGSLFFEGREVTSDS